MHSTRFCKSAVGTYFCLNTFTIYSGLLCENIVQKMFDLFPHQCPVHVICTGRRMSKLADWKLVLNDKYLLFLSLLTAVEFYNLGHIQGII